MLEFIPDRPALCHDTACTVDLLVRVTPPKPVETEERPGINLCLVIDRSGSMQGEKIDLTRKAAALTVKSLRKTDRLSIVSFSSDVLTVVASTAVSDKEHILKQIERIEAHGGTALFDGWKGGAAQACLGLDDRHLNRLVLLTDGQANIGETNPDTICNEVNRLAQKGLQTTTLGFGKDYHEGLLRSMSASGGGNHFFVETPDQLARFIELELDGLAATLGTRVRLRLIRQHQEIHVEPLGEVQTTPEGSYQLADLTLDFPLELLFRVSLPAAQEAASGLSAELEWHSPSSGETHRLEVPLELPRLSASQRAALPIHPDVETKLAVAMAARARREAMEAMKRGDQGAATRILREALETKKLPDLEQAQLRQLQQTVDKGDQNTSQKIFSAQSYSYSRGSVLLGAIEEQLLSGWMDQGLVPLRYGPIFQQGPQGTPELARFEGMLGGLWAGDSGGEVGTLSLETLRLMSGQNRFLPWVGTFLKQLADAKIENPSPSFKSFRDNVEKGETFMLSGANNSDCGALCRLAPLLLCRRLKPGPSHWVFLIMGAQVTHNDAASTAACVAFGNLLWELMVASAPPPSLFYVERFLDVLSQIERPDVYSSVAPRHDGWKGTLSEFISLLIPDARRRGLSFAEARLEWGPGPAVLETVPTLLYLLECHGHQPQLALRQATNNTPEAAWLGPLAGAALGAIHGLQPGWELKGEVASAYKDFLAKQC